MNRLIGKIEFKCKVSQTSQQFHQMTVFDDLFAKQTLPASINLLCCHNSRDEDASSVIKELTIIFSFQIRTKKYLIIEVCDVTIKASTAGFELPI